MTTNAPGRNEREGLTLPQLFAQFPDDLAAERWFEAQRWPTGRFCPDCGSADTHPVTSGKPMPYRCRTCRRYFSVRKGTAMQSSKLGLQKWAIAIYLMATGLKGTSSMKIHRDLGIRQATAWHLMQRIREAFGTGDGELMPGPVEADETYIGGKEGNKHADRKLHAGRGTVGKAAVVAVKDRASNRIAAQPVARTDKATLQGFVSQHAAADAAIYTDEHGSYRGLPNHHAVKHSVGEYVNGMIHTNGVESFWSMVKRGYVGTFHHYSPKHLHRYINEFSGRHNIRPQDTPAQMAVIARGLVGKRLPYGDLVAGPPAYP